MVPGKARARKIDQKLAATAGALTLRNEKLLALRSDFDALTLAFWAAFADNLGNTGKRDRHLFGGFWMILGLIVIVMIRFGANLWAFVIAGFVISFFIAPALIEDHKRRREISQLLATEQRPFWLTGGPVALSNLSTTAPVGAKWWWKEHTAFVFVRHLSARFSIDASTRALIWQEPHRYLVDETERLTGQQATSILQALFAANPRYQRLVDSFGELASLESQWEFLQDLKAEADQGLAEEQHTAELQKAQQPVPEASRPCSEPAPSIVPIKSTPRSFLASPSKSKFRCRTRRRVAPCWKCSSGRCALRETAKRSSSPWRFGVKAKAAETFVPGLTKASSRPSNAALLQKTSRSCQRTSHSHNENPKPQNTSMKKHLLTLALSLTLPIIAANAQNFTTQHLGSFDYYYGDDGSSAVGQRIGNFYYLNGTDR